MHINYMLCSKSAKVFKLMIVYFSKVKAQHKKYYGETGSGFSDIFKEMAWSEI